MTEGPAGRPNRGRLVLVLFGIVVGAAAAWLLVKAPARPPVPLETPRSEGPEQPIAYYLARGDIVRGVTQFQRCAACHRIEEGAPPGVGPNLWGVMGNPLASRPGYEFYSPALRAHGGRWDWDTASRFVRSPRDVVPGTHMAFYGVTNPQERADLLLYLNSKGGVLQAPAAAR